MDIFSFLRRPCSSPGVVSYAQCGEDIIADFIFCSLGISQPTYMDLGAHDPSLVSNTFYFYKKGGWGVLVEPDPEACRTLRAKRPRDKVIQAGIGTLRQPSADFYVMNPTTLSTFSKSEAERLSKDSAHSIDRVIHVPMVTWADLLEKWFREGAPDFVSLDVEDMNEAVLRSCFSENVRPSLYCVETLTYEPNGEGVKLDGILEFMKDQGYMVFADTYINTLFVDEVRWKKRKR